MAIKFMGDVTPEETMDALKTNPDARMVDVRTAAEWAFVGQPDLTSTGQSQVTVEWQSYPGMQVNDDFVEQVKASGLTTANPIYLLCRSGVRSLRAAEILALHGFTTYNIANGFEGHLDGAGHRGMGGWKAAGLPWRQS